MPVLKLKAINGFLHFDADQCAETGALLAAQYQSAHPFPHIVMEDFLSAPHLRDIVSDFPDRGGHTYFDRAQERFKYQFDPNGIESSLIRNLLSELNSAPFLSFLENMTGIQGLIPDPHFDGAGLHETLSGGHLSIHADFNVHGKMKLERRLNLLIYLNDDWLPEYGGELELWDKEMRCAARSVLPILGRAVVFSTNRDSFHGQPNPLNCPPDRSRRSIATYYYTAFERAEGVSPRNTAFQARPGTTDRDDWKGKLENFVTDWTPPRLKRYALRLIRRKSDSFSV